MGGGGPVGGDPTTRRRRCMVDRGRWWAALQPGEVGVGLASLGLRVDAAPGEEPEGGLLFGWQVAGVVEVLDVGSPIRGEARVHARARRGAAPGGRRSRARVGQAWSRRPRRPVGPGGCEIRRARPTAGTRPRVQPIPRAIAPPDGVRPKSSSPSDSRSCTLPATQSGRGREDERVGSESGEEAPIDTRAGAASRCARFEQAAYALRARVLGAERRRALGLARLGAGAEARPARNRWRGRGHGGKTMFTLSERGRLALRSVGRRRA